MGCFGGQSHSVRSMGRLITAVWTSGQSYSDLELRPSGFRLSPGSALATAPSMADIAPSLGCQVSSKAAA